MVDAQVKTAMTRAAYDANPIMCPCGQPIEYERRHTARYHERCVRRYGQKRQANPSNYVTFNCETCEIEVTRYKKYGNGHNKFCSNACAQKWTRKVRHIGIADADVVLDSGWEALVWGWATFLKLPIERVDRVLAVEWKEGQFYAPDFNINGTWVEVKGQSDPGDAIRWAAWEQEHGPILVVDASTIGALVGIRSLADLAPLQPVLSPHG
jgi:hypothetical protein